MRHPNLPVRLRSYRVTFPSSTQQSHGSSAGFSAEVHSKDDKRQIGELLASVEPEDLIRYGLIPEFVGRLPVMATLEELDEDALVRILTEPKNALIKQYRRMFELDDVELEFDVEALEAIADLAVSRKTGARGLRAILEEVLGPIMFEIPSTDDVDKVVITRAAVEEAAPPTLVLRQKRKSA